MHYISTYQHEEKPRCPFPDMLYSRNANIAPKVPIALRMSFKPITEAEVEGSYRM
jgi:hypothetical protein